MAGRRAAGGLVLRRQAPRPGRPRSVKSRSRFGKDLEIDRQTDRQTGRQAGRQTDRQTDRHICVLTIYLGKGGVDSGTLRILSSRTGRMQTGSDVSVTFVRRVRMVAPRPLQSAKSCPILFFRPTQAGSGGSVDKSHGRSGGSAEAHPRNPPGDRSLLFLATASVLPPALRGHQAPEREGRPAGLRAGLRAAGDAHNYSIRTRYHSQRRQVPRHLVMLIC